MAKQNQTRNVCMKELRVAATMRVSHEERDIIKALHIDVSKDEHAEIVFEFIKKALKHKTKSEIAEEIFLNIGDPNIVMFLATCMLNNVDSVIKD
jgi:hypothetical protein